MPYKIVIWDLDETFWKGTLSEGMVEPIEKNIFLVKALVDRGIMNSIVSKNDYNKAMKILKDWGVDEYFIFSKISWEPKGQRVKELLDECGLRAENAIFIDDNPSNREEVKYYNPKISCMDPVLLDEYILLQNDFRGKNDVEHTRLIQYKTLEKRLEKKKTYSTNIDFLRSSHIKISVKSTCIDQIDRIEELIQRTNQLNYTKNRMPKEELLSLLQDSNVESAFIEARDDFGDYGIVGFYALKNNVLIHFLFSCRVLGFGIENYLYSNLGYPEIKIVGETTIPLEKNSKVDWITETLFDATNSPESAIKKDSILFIGGCDLASAVNYLEIDFEVKKEFNTVINGQEYRTSDTSQLVGARELDVQLQNELCNNLPFMTQEITFATDLYSQKYKVIVLSLVDDYIRGVYRSKTNPNCYITYGAYWSAKEDLVKYSKAELEYLKSHFYFDGKETLLEFKRNIEKIISNVGGCKLILINGIELDVSNWIGLDRCNRNVEMNAVIDEVIQSHPEVGLVDMRKIVTSRNQCVKHDNRHFDRRSYYLMAQEILRQSKDAINTTAYRSRSMWETVICRYLGAIKRRLKSILNA